jgi:hypothetical protein
MSFEERGIGEVTEVLNATEKDLAEANELAGTFTLEDTRRVRLGPLLIMTKLG